MICSICLVEKEEELFPKTPSGLHVQDNLRCISAELNARKGNRYWPDMP